MNSLFSMIALSGIAVLEYLQFPDPVYFILAAFFWTIIGRGILGKLA